MTERERLIELLEIRHFLTAETTADFLLDNGVRLPVTCGECKYAEKQGVEIVGYHCEKTIVWRMGNDFCSYGERRADND